MAEEIAKKAEQAVNEPTVDELIDSGKLDELVRSGKITNEQASERLQEAARRHTAEHGPDLDTNADGVETTGGPGSGQGMQKQRTGQGPSS
jgi:polyhydroxyalkanoate synthesis regulator phasin